MDGPNNPNLHAIAHFNEAIRCFASLRNALHA
jgi:hypothetical protein